MIRTARVSVDQDALRHNLRRVRQLAPDSRIMAVIKADAYGHGMLQAARVLSDADGFAVACTAEALALREAGVNQPITVFQGFQSVEELQRMAAVAIRPVIHQHWQMDMLEAQVLAEPMSVWLKADTGMGRLGLAPRQVVDGWHRLAACPQVSDIGLMSHFANADVPDHDLNRQQLECFAALRGMLPADARIPTSQSNSAGLIAFPQARGDWVRPGIMLYGASPFQQGAAADLGLKPVMRLYSRLVAVNYRNKGDTVGYGSLWRCPQDMPVGVVGIGYGDGYPRHVAQGTPVWINGRRSQILGRVSMDMITVDLRAVDNPRCGDEVELWGTEVTVDEVARHADTIAYQLLCNVSGCRVE